jgi:acyl dehydratase
MNELRIGPLTRTDIVRFAGAGGDFNPLHHDEEYARAAGFPTVFSMGQFQAGLLSRLVAEELGTENVRAFKVRFKAKVWPGDVLIMRGRATGHGRYEFEAVREDGGEVAVQAWVTAEVTE